MWSPPNIELKLLNYLIQFWKLGWSYLLKSKSKRIKDLLMISFLEIGTAPINRMIVSSSLQVASVLFPLTVARFQFLFLVSGGELCNSRLAPNGSSRGRVRGPFLRADDNVEEPRGAPRGSIAGSSPVWSCHATGWCPQLLTRTCIQLPISFICYGRSHF